MQNNFDVKNTKEALRFMVAFAGAVDKSAENGYGWEDAMNFIPVATKAPSAFGDMQLIPKELSEVNDSEAMELIAEVEQLDLRNDAAELVVEQGLKSVLEISGIIQNFIETIKVAKEAA